MMFVLNVIPMGKPRMTQADRWKKRPSVLRYRSFKDEVRTSAGGDIEDIRKLLLDGAKVRFDIPMPQSWSRKKREEHRGMPHLQKPDLDNLQKALFDSLMKEDSGIWHIRTKKVWTDGPGGISILPIIVL